MKILWHGHSCFEVITDEGSVVFDPYCPGSVPGLTLPKLRADRVICSHGHRDHCFSDGVELTGKTPLFALRQFEVFHDGEGGKLRGKNTMTLMEAEGCRILHMGDLGHELSREMISDIGPVDVLMVPVGGYYTVDALQAHKVSEALKARLVIPMHYRGEGFGYKEISTVDEFLGSRENVRRMGGNVIDTAAFSGRCTLVPQLK